MRQVYKLGARGDDELKMRLWEVDKMEAACAAVTSVRGTVPAGMVYRARAVGELAGKVTLRLRGCYCVWLGRNVETVSR